MMEQPVENRLSPDDRLALHFAIRALMAAQAALSGSLKGVLPGNEIALWNSQLVITAEIEEFLKRRGVI